VTDRMPNPLPCGCGAVPKPNVHVKHCPRHANALAEIDRLREDVRALAEALRLIRPAVDHVLIDMIGAFPVRAQCATSTPTQATGLLGGCWCGTPAANG